MKVSELLCSPDRWLQGKGLKLNADGQRSFCLYGAITYAYCFRPDGKTASDVLERVKDELKVTTFTDIMNWNDAPERTFEEVKALVNKLEI